ncbi:MAG: hypothetical protein ACF8TS_14530 [Maioricimonas sp. JB049]
MSVSSSFSTQVYKHGRGVGAAVAAACSSEEEVTAVLELLVGRFVEAKARSGRRVSLTRQLSGFVNNLEKMSDSQAELFLKSRDLVELLLEEGPVGTLSSDWFSKVVKKFRAEKTRRYVLDCTRSLSDDTWMELAMSPSAQLRNLVAGYPECPSDVRVAALLGAGKNGKPIRNVDDLRVPAHGFTVHMLEALSGSMSPAVLATVGCARIVSADARTEAFERLVSLVSERASAKPRSSDPTVYRRLKELTEAYRALRAVSVEALGVDKALPAVGYVRHDTASWDLQRVQFATWERQLDVGLVRWITERPSRSSREGTLDEIFGAVPSSSLTEDSTEVPHGTRLRMLKKLCDNSGPLSRDELGRFTAFLRESPRLTPLEVQTVKVAVAPEDRELFLDMLSQVDRYRLPVFLRDRPDVWARHMSAGVFLGNFAPEDLFGSDIQVDPMLLLELIPSFPGPAVDLVKAASSSR